MALVGLFPVSSKIFQFGDFSFESLNFFGELIVLLPNFAEYDKNFISFFSKDLVVIGVCGCQLLQIAILTSQLAH
jgi:phosphoribosylformylglycinamidine (FGAM) synthase-like amidotransferase family enzyme